ncbi:MAG: hypothetical protein HYZ35_02045, partial [Chloroflexi bacterium]|nr:hypothetical protein [Chloroflexota bacterium]
MSVSDRLPVTVRPANSDDIALITAFDHSFSTDYVWQMDLREEQGQVSVNFRQVRLPRSLRVLYPRNSEALAAHWTDRNLFVVAEVLG